MILIVDWLLCAGVTPDDIPAGCDKICKNTETKNIVAFGGGRSFLSGHFLSSAEEDDIQLEIISVSELIAAYNLRNTQLEETPEHHQTIEQLIAQMDTLADMAKRHTMEQIRLRELIAARLNPLGYYLAKK